MRCVTRKKRLQELYSHKDYLMVIVVSQLSIFLNKELCFVITITSTALLLGFDPRFIIYSLHCILGKFNLNLIQLPNLLRILFNCTVRSKLTTLCSIQHS